MNLQLKERRIDRIKNNTLNQQGNKDVLVCFVLILFVFDYFVKELEHESVLEQIE